MNVVNSAKAEFDCARLQQLSGELKSMLAALEDARVTKDEAEEDWRRLDTRVSNLKIELTRLVDGYLDMDTLKQRAPERFQVEA